MKEDGQQERQQNDESRGAQSPRGSDCFPGIIRLVPPLDFPERKNDSRGIGSRGQDQAGADYKQRSLLLDEEAIRGRQGAGEHDTSQCGRRNH